jgi:hypothetical protein
MALAPTRTLLDPRSSTRPPGAVGVGTATAAPRRRGAVDAPREVTLHVETPRAAHAATRALVTRRFHAALADPSPERLAALRCAVTTLVDHLRSTVASAAEVVEYVRATLPPSADPTSRAPDAPTDALRVRQQVLAWCRGAYRDDAWW